MPGPTVHYRLTARWAREEGLDEPEAQRAAVADTEVDRLWPGSEKWSRHFNPTATLFWAPYYLVRAARDVSPVLLGYALHCRQDGIGHGGVGLAHLRFRFGMLERDPDVWETMPARKRAAIERDTRRMVRWYVAEVARKAAGAGPA